MADKISKPQVKPLDNVQGISIKTGNSVIAENDLLKSLPLTLLLQLTHQCMEGVCAAHEGCQVVKGHSHPAGDSG